MSIKVGERLPSVTLMHMTEKGPAPITTDELFGKKKAVLFALPGAFTPTCSAQHLPGYLAQQAALAAKGVDEIWCVSVNDAFVMHAWGKAQGVAGKLRMLADGSADLAKALGLTLDLTARGMGLRSQRFAMLIKDGVVTDLQVEAAGKFEVSKAEFMLSRL